MIRMRLSSRPCLPTGLLFLVLLQLAFKVSLQEGIGPTEGAPNEEDIQDLQLEIDELQDKMDDLRKIVFNILIVLLGPEGAIVDHKLFKRPKSHFAKDKIGSFRGAKNECDDNLALPRNAAENEALQSVVEQRRGSAVLGLSYNSDKKQFEDVGGKPVLFFNWAPGQPNVLKNKECVKMEEDGHWYITDCEEWLPIICEFII